MTCWYQAADVATHIINTAIRSGQRISNLQLQKLLYYCQCQYLQETGESLFDDDIVAWQYGPVVKDVYYAYSYRGASDILVSDTVVMDHVTGRVRAIRPLTGQALEVVDTVCNALRGLSAWSLVSKSHRPGGAWDKVYNNGGEGYGYGDVIPGRLMMLESVL